MSSSLGTYHVEMQGQFAEVIGALALAHAADDWTSASDQIVERHSDLITWIRASSAQREPWVMRLAIEAATRTNQVGSSSATTAIDSGIYYLRMEDPNWFDREMAFWTGGESASLLSGLSDAAHAALERKLPAELSPEEALSWAKELAASLR